MAERILQQETAARDIQPALLMLLLGELQLGLMVLLRGDLHALFNPFHHYSEHIYERCSQS